MITNNNKTGIEISVDNLKPGMYVCDLDRPWLGTPYLIQGILIESQDDIDELARHCTYVYVDRDKSELSVNLPLPPRKASAAPQRAQDADILKIPFLRAETYTDTCTAEEELPAALQAYDIAAALFNEINSNIERNTKLDIHAAHDVVDALRESVVRNPDAALLLARLKTTGQVLYDSAINNSVRLLALGRHLGLPRKELSLLGMGGLLMDIGKLNLPKEIQTKSGFSLNSSERKLVKQHVSYGETILAQSSDIPEAVHKIVAQHHERENGNGFPRGLYANQLHVYARMAAIVDCYEELIVERLGMPAARPFHAIRELRDSSNRGLNSTLVEQFAQCIGIFPVGSLVELNTGEIAIVLAHNRAQRFLPHIMIIFDPKKQPYDTPLTLDLRSAGPGPGGIPYTIIGDLPQGAYGIDAKQYYL